MLWDKTFGGSERDYAYFFQQTSDGGFIITGESNSSVLRYSGQLWLIKTDGNGNMLWDRTFGRGEGLCAKQTSDGGYIIVGNTYSSGAGKCDIRLIKTDGNGTIDIKQN
jgi:hypothetical protein